MGVIKSVALIVFICMMIWIIVFAVAYRRRNRIFKRLASEFDMHLSINHLPLWRLVTWGDQLELRRLIGTARGKEVAIRDERCDHAILHWQSGVYWWKEPCAFSPFSDNPVHDIIGGMQ
jgi:hypothetical protein